MASTPSYFVSWGMITVGVKAYVAARDGDDKVELTNLHAKCGAVLKQLTTCTGCGAVVPKEETVKGFEQAKGQYVLVSQAELAALAAEQTKTMEIKSFVPWDQIDPVYLGRSNYLGPVDVSAAKAFALLRTAMEKAQLAAVVQYVGSGGHEKLGVIRVVGQALMLHDLFYETEIRTYEGQDRSGIKQWPALSDQELQLAEQLVTAQVAEKFDVSDLRDGYNERLQKLVEAKVLGQEPPKIVSPVAAPPVTDLLEALKSSLAKAKGKVPAVAKPKRAKKAA